MTNSSYPKRKISILLISVFIIATCGILYELLISTLSSYFQGSSILHFSLVIGLFLSFMGVGSFISKYINNSLLEWFIIFELILAIFGGLSSFLLYFAFSLTPYFYLVAFLLIGLLGSLIGVEVPLLTRIVRRYTNLSDALANVLSFDYLGALIASVLFPLVLLPFLGTMRTSFIIGLLNVSVAWVNIFIFREEINKSGLLRITASAITLILCLGFVFSFQLIGFFETYLYRDEILLSRQSAYQQIVMTRWNEDTRLYLQGSLQFSSRDEYRYHEPLVHVPMALSSSKSNVLLLGAGDGLATREILHYDQVEKITLVDIDPEMTKIARQHPIMVSLNDSALHNPRVQVIHQDAYKFIEESSDLYNVVIIDLPDPHHPSLGKLYSYEFYLLVKKRLAAGGVIVTQSTSPYFAPEAFWCINTTLEQIFPRVIPYTVNVPSFGQWGYNLGMQSAKISLSHNKTAVADSIREPDFTLFIEKISTHIRQTKSIVPYRYLNENIIPGIFEFDPDMQKMPVKVNHLDNQEILRYYEKGFSTWR